MKSPAVRRRLTTRVGRFVLIPLCSLLPLDWMSAGCVTAAEKPAVDRLFPPGGQAGTTVETRLNGKPGSEPMQVWSDRSQLQLTVTEKQDAATIIIPADAVPGVHWLRFYNSEGATGLVPFLVGTLTEVAEQEPNNRLEEVQSLDTPATVVNGVLEKAGDVDCYSVPVQTGQTLVASLLGHRVLESPMDAVLQLLNSQGTVLWQNDDDHGLDPQIVFTAEKDERLIVRVFAFPAAPNSSIQFSGGSNYVYRLTMTTGPFVDHTLPQAVTQGQSAKVTLEGWNLPDDIRQSSVDVSMQSDSAEIRIEQPQLAEACILKVLPFASLTEEQATAELAVPFAVTGRIDQPAQTDEYRFQGKKNQKIECQVIARAEYSLLDPVLSVHDANGKELKQADDIAKENLDAQTSLTLPADGMYTVRIQDRFAHGGFRYFYRVEVQETRPDFQLTVKEHEVRVDPAKATELTVTVARTDGFSEEIHLTVSGLPEGVVCEPATSLKEGDSAKAVTLKLTGQSVTGFQNPIAIVGNTDGGQSHLAESTAITAPGPRTAIWLTVPATPVPEAAAAEAEAKPATPDPAAAAK